MSEGGQERNYGIKIEYGDKEAKDKVTDFACRCCQGAEPECY
ncbi:MAG TPA: hypothetical protein VMV76_06620 [Dehalococcoidia bacterium]|nr:hypothetical protein [Dehalococcoidia bacterium]